MMEKLYKQIRREFRVAMVRYRNFEEVAMRRFPYASADEYETALNNYREARDRVSNNIQFIVNALGLDEYDVLLTLSIDYDVNLTDLDMHI